MRRRPILALLSAFLICAVGCNESGTQEKNTAPPAPSSETLLRIHWIGKRQLTLEGSAFYFNRLWDLPETQQLEARVLDAFATAPWRLGGDPTAVRQAPVGPLRWILESVKYEESFWELQAATNESFSFALAIRLSDKDSEAWQTNMAFVINSLTGVPPLSSPTQKKGWTLNHPSVPFRYELARDRGWTLFGISKQQNNALRMIAERVRSSEIPFGNIPSNGWVSIYADCARLEGLLDPGSSNKSNLPTINVRLSGDGGNVLTHASIHFPAPAVSSLSPWNSPTGHIYAPVSSFTAMRGVSNVLQNSKFWRLLSLGEAPDQLFLWSSSQGPFHIYAAAPVGNPATRLKMLGSKLMNEVNPWLRNNGPKIGDSGVPMFEHTTDGGLQWNIPGLVPFLKPLTAANNDYLWIGLTSAAAAGKHADLTEIAKLLENTNVVCASWEDTSVRMEEVLPVLQTARVLAHHPALPENALSLAWINAIRPRIDKTQTIVTVTPAGHLELHRKSSLGLTALELQLLADWIESPSFPIGLHTFVAPAPAGE